MTGPDATAAKIAELRAATREANAAIKDARAARRELTAAVEEFQQDAVAWRRRIEGEYMLTMATAAAEGLDALVDAVEKAEERLNTRMDTVMEVITKPYQTSRGPRYLEEILRGAHGEDARL